MQLYRLIYSHCGGEHGDKKAGTALENSLELSSRSTDSRHRESKTKSVKISVPVTHFL